MLPFGTFEITNAVSSNPLLNASAETEKGAKGFTATIYAASVPQPGHANEDALFVGRLSGAPLAAVFDGQGNAEGAAKESCPPVGTAVHGERRQTGLGENHEASGLSSAGFEQEHHGRREPR